ncbi:MAG: phage terminase large subunit [Candidatus Sericytochromatia bacterium]|nr:phage terminase large subunit [Candidatus Sericytochromatia bacterium]
MSISPTTVEPVILRPQPGPQETFLSSPADIAIYGGAAGGGKTFALLLETLRNIGNPGFRAVIFRRTFADVVQSGGIWEDTETMYPQFGARSNQQTLAWEFPSKAKVGFAHLQHEKDKLKYQGAQIPLIAFDELTHFTETQFFYLLSRNRSTCGVIPYMRATTNPDAESWVASLISWWWDAETGFAIPERSGVIRWIVRDGNDIHWYDSKAEAQQQHPKSLPLSFTFVPARLEDNPALLKKDPAYKAKLQALPLVERARLLGGNWKIKPAAGLYFKREWWQSAVRAPEFTKLVRAWDLAGSKDGDYTAGVLMGITADKSCYVLDLKRFKGTPGQVRNTVLATAQADAEQWGRVTIRIPQDPGQAGVDQRDSYSKMLSGYRVRFLKPTGSKVIRAAALSSQVEAGTVFLMQASWNESLQAEAEQFPDGSHDDIIDALADAYNELAGKKASSFNR